jgi:glycosyltransferase involved in cell wall biosynthesis
VAETRILVAQLGPRKYYQEPILFHRWGILSRLYTDFYIGHNKVVNFLRKPEIHGFLPNSIKKGLDRYDPDLGGAEIIHFPNFAYRYLCALRNAANEQTASIYLWGGKELCRRVIKSGLGNANTIYAFNSASLELFEHAKKFGVRCILDQTSADYSLSHQLILEEEQRWQGWSIMPFAVSKSHLDLMRREQQEQVLADEIICGSDFVKQSLLAAGIESKKIKVIPLGRLKEDNVRISHPTIFPIRKKGDVLKVLFVGLVSLTKGIQYLLRALQELKREIPFICKIAGTVEYSTLCEFLGRVPHSEIRELYAWADVVVLPSICEGSAMVAYEALSVGVPIITTNNAGSIVRNDLDGYIVPIRDVEAIADRLLRIYKSGDAVGKKYNTQEYLRSAFNQAESRLRQAVASGW